MAIGNKIERAPSFSKAMHFIVLTLSGDIKGGKFWITFCQKKLFWKYLKFEFLRHLLRTYIIDNFSWCFQIHILLVGTISPLHFPYRILTELINDSQIALYFWFLAPLCILPGIEQTWHAPLLPALLNRQHASVYARSGKACAQGQ